MTKLKTFMAVCVVALAMVSCKKDNTTVKLDLSDFKAPSVTAEKLAVSLPATLKTSLSNIKDVPSQIEVGFAGVEVFNSQISSDISELGTPPETATLTNLKSTIKSYEWVDGGYGQWIDVSEDNDSIYWARYANENGKDRAGRNLYFRSSQLKSDRATALGVTTAYSIRSYVNLPYSYNYCLKTNGDVAIKMMLSYSSTYVYLEVNTNSDASTGNAVLYLGANDQGTKILEATWTSSGGTYSYYNKGVKTDGKF